MTNRYDKPRALNKVFEESYATFEKKDGGDYEPESIRVDDFSCMLLVSNHMIFVGQFGRNKHS